MADTGTSGSGVVGKASTERLRVRLLLADEDVDVTDAEEVVLLETTFCVSSWKSRSASSR